MPTTEIATFSLSPGNDIGDPDNKASAVLNDCGNVLMKQPGLLAFRFGPFIEEPSKMQMFVDWESVQNHHDFEKASAFQGFLSQIRSIMAGPPSFMHVDWKQPEALAAVLQAPVTEVATMYFDGEPPASYFQAADDFFEACMNGSPDLRPMRVAQGVTQEVVEREGVKGKAVVFALGWESKEQHVALTQTEAFRANVDLLRRGPGAAEMHHTTFMEFVAS